MAHTPDAIEKPEIGAQTGPQIKGRGGFAGMAAFDGDGAAIKKPPAGTIKTYDEMRENPTIALARAFVRAPILAANIVPVKTSEDVDGVVGRVIRPGQMPVAGEIFDVGIAEPGQGLLRQLHQLGDALDRIDLGAQLCQHRRLIAASGADLEGPVAGAEIQELGHDGNDVGL